MNKEFILNIIVILIFGLGISGIGLVVLIDCEIIKDINVRNVRINEHIILHKPFNDIIKVESSFISGADDWYFVSILVTTNKHPGSPQWIYDFRYDEKNDKLYYDDNIEGIEVIN